MIVTSFQRRTEPGLQAVWHFPYTQKLDRALCITPLFDVCSVNRLLGTLTISTCDIFVFIE